MSSSSVVLPQDDGNPQVSYFMYCNWHKLWESSIFDVKNSEKPLYHTQHVFGKNPDLTWTLSRADEGSIADSKSTDQGPAEDRIISTGKIFKHNFDVSYTCHGHDDVVKVVLHMRQPSFRSIYKWRSNTVLDNGEPKTFTWKAVSGLKRWNWVCVDDKDNVVSKWAANLWHARNVGQISFFGPLAHNEAFREEVITTGLLANYNVCFQESGIYRFFGSMGSMIGQKKGNEKGVPSSSSADDGDDAMSTLSTTDTLAAKEDNDLKKKY